MHFLSRSLPTSLAKQTGEFPSHGEYTASSFLKHGENKIQQKKFKINSSHHLSTFSAKFSLLLTQEVGPAQLHSLGHQQTAHTAL